MGTGRSSEAPSEGLSDASNGSRSVVLARRALCCHSARDDSELAQSEGLVKRLFVQSCALRWKVEIRPTGSRHTGAEGLIAGVHQHRDMKTDPSQRVHVS